MLSIAAFGIWGTLGPFWAMPTAFLRGTAAAGGIAIVNSIGNIGGFVGPFRIGWVRDATGSFDGGLLTLAGVLVVGRRDRAQPAGCAFSSAMSASSSVPFPRDRVSRRRRGAALKLPRPFCFHRPFSSAYGTCAGTTLRTASPAV